MDFGLTEEQRDIQGLARRLLGEQVTPERLARFDNFAVDGYDEPLWAQLAEAGLLGIAAPAAHGGMGFGFLEAALFLEEVGRTVPMVPAVAHIAGGVIPLSLFGSAAQQDRLLPPAITGELLLSAALGDDARFATLEATADGDGFRVSGTLDPVPYAAQAHRVLAAARAGEGIVVLMLDPRAAGVTSHALKVTHYEPHARLELANVRVDAADVLAGTADGARVLARMNEIYAIALCAHQVGVCDSMMRRTAAYTSERKQFGVPIATFQAVGHRAANCFIDVECLRLTTYEAASLIGSGEAAAVEADVAKVWAGDVGHRVSYAAQHLHGGAGVDRGNPLWRYCLWARHNEMTLGSSAQRLARLGERCAAGEALLD